MPQRGPAAGAGVACRSSLTAVAALEVLGPDATFATEVVAAGGPSDGTSRATCGSSAAAIRCCRPTPYAAHFHHQPQIHTDFEALADAMVAAGVTRVDRPRVGDESRYDEDRYPDAWPQRYIDQDQSGPLSALTVNDGFTAFPPNPDTRVPDEEPADEPAVHAAGLLTAAARGAGRGRRAASPAAGVAPADHTAVAAVDSPPLRDIVDRDAARERQP